MRYILRMAAAAAATAIIAIGGAWICRGEFGVGSEWALPVIAAAIIPLKEGGKRKS